MILGDILLNSLYILGKLWFEKENLDKFEILLHSDQLKKSTKSVLLLMFNKNEGNLKYDKIIEKAYDSSDNSKYLYRKGSSRGTNITPSSLIIEPEKTFKIKFFKWFENNKKKDIFISSLYDAIESEQQRILDELKLKYDSVDDNNNILLSFAIKEGDRTNYLGDYKIFEQVLIEETYKKYYKSSLGNFKGIGECSLCGEEKEVFGLVPNSIGFKFSTPDKKGNIPGNITDNHWKQNPICGNCGLYLESGKKFVDTYLKFSEFGLNYYVIPTFFFDNEKGFENIYKYILRNENNETYQENLVSKEEKLVKIVKELDDILEFKFLFFEADKNAFNILGYIESVLPSWLNTIYESQLRIKNQPIFSEEVIKDVFGKNSEGNLIDYINFLNKKNKNSYFVNEFNWYISFLRDFFSYFSYKMYIEIVVSVFNQKKINFDFLLSIFMKKIRQQWKQNNISYIKLNTMKVLSLILLFDYLDLFKGENKMHLKFKDIDSEESFLKIDDILNSNDKKAVFLLGSLTRKLTYIQYKELGSSPFINKLWGLNLDQKKIKKLYPMVLNKLSEYKTSFSDLEESISTNLILSEKDWNLTKDETSYYFVLGYTMAFTLKKFSENTEGDKDE